MEKDLEDIVRKIQSKTALLLSLETPPVFKADDKGSEDVTMARNPSFVRSTSLTNKVGEEWKTELKVWRNDLEDLGFLTN